MLFAIAYGVPVQAWDRSANITPPVAIAVAVLVARLVIWHRFSIPTSVGAALGGAMWAYLADRWGPPLPTLMAIVAVAALAAGARRAESSG